MARELLSGNQAVAHAARLARTGFVAAYPITPQTTIIETLAEFIGRGQMNAEFVPVESEHSALAACIGASLAGSRTFTATSSQGLALMHEVLHWASGQRTPIVMANVNRALGPPWNIWVDHTDSMSQRDTGWMQIFAETNQEALDATLIAFRVAEDRRVSLPAMVLQDAFLLSHTYMAVEVPEQSLVDDYLPPFAPHNRIVPGEPTLFGSFSPPDLVFAELRHDQAQAMTIAEGVFEQASREYAERVGREPIPIVDEYRTEGADAVLLACGSLAATARDAVDLLRDEGVRVGLARPTLFRPFPHKALHDLARRVGVFGVVDRAHSLGQGAPLATEIRASLSGTGSPPAVASFVAGLGGRDVPPQELAKIMRRLVAGDTPREEWIGIKEVA